MLLQIFFWLLVAAVFYTYAGYPLLIYLLSRVCKKPVQPGNRGFDVSVIIAAYNEEAAIADKIERTLHQDYPGGKLEVIVASDGSTDRTDEIVRSYAGSGVKLCRYEGRRGKTYCQNETVAQSGGQIVVFTDATTEYDGDAVRHIVEPFADESVGCVCAELSYVPHRKGLAQVGESEGMYWRVEKKLREMESRFSSCMGASGALYAVRRSVYTPLHAGLISDFVEPLMVVMKGYRSVYHSAARCLDETAKSFKSEYDRKVRTILRGLNSLSAVKPLFNPFKYGIVALQLFSHKVLRWLMPVCLLLLLAVNALLLPGALYIALGLAQIAFYLLALAGFLIRVKPFSVAHYFVLLNAASLTALFQYLMGKNRVAWDTER